jgi:predicted translin family RNA/ssDNA-binding protein
MINKQFTKKLKQDYDQHESERRQIISQSNIVLHGSKRVIFSLLREDNKAGAESLKEIEKSLVGLEKKFGMARLLQEGSYKAANEEYVEAKLLSKVLTGEEISTIKEVNLDYESYLGGICDLTGEMVRRAINQAAKGKYKDVEKIKNEINDIMAELVEFDMTGYLRTKYDQAKGNLKKIEQINYEIKIRK